MWLEHVQQAELLHLQTTSCLYLTGEQNFQQSGNYTPLQVAIGTGFACGGFCIQFGCDWIAFFYASLAAAVGMYLRGWLLRKGFNNYMGIAVAAFVSTLIAFLTMWLPSSWTSTPLHPLLACGLFIVPGVPLINFVDVKTHFRTKIIRKKYCTFEIKY